MDPVRRYLACLGTGAWDELPACLAPDVERIGPYGDVVRGRAEYAEFLRATITSLPGYVLEVARIVDADTTVVVELAETIDVASAAGARLRTDEAVVFDVDDGLITRVAVYLRTSVRT